MSRPSEPSRPKFFIALGSAATAALFVSSQFVPIYENLVLKIAGVATLPLSLLFMIAPFYYLKKYGRVETKKSFVYTTQVVDCGVYGIVRHPQYVGYALLNLALALLNWHWATAVAATLAILFFYLQSIQEEQFCQQQLGTAYETYCRHVPRFNFLLGFVEWVNRKQAA